MRLFADSDATFCACSQHTDDRCAKACTGRPYRYTLHRRFPLYAPGPERPVLFIMLNPSTANHIDPDPTITRCTDFAFRWGHTELVVCNLFAWRSTDPMVLPQIEDPVGPENDRHIAEQAVRAARVVVAWGNHGHLHNRQRAVLDLLQGLRVEPWCFRVTKAAAPEHPLYQKSAAQLIRFEIK